MKQLRPYQVKAVSETLTALESNDPVLMMASVGAGKSLMLARIILKFQKKGMRCLCLINNAELVRSNAQAFKEEGGRASIYCSSLKEKDISELVIFASSQSVHANLKKDIGKIKFDLIVVDEAHAINYQDSKSTFMQILNNFYKKNAKLKLLGATGTNFRYKGASIVGEDCLFKTQTGNITTSQLITDNYLVRPKFAFDPKLFIDFSRVKLRAGKFNGRELNDVVSHNERLTYRICKQIELIMSKGNRFGAFIFASTKRHAEEIYSYLPQQESALILGDTPQSLREVYLNKARKGEIKYLINIAVLTVGIDVPSFDTVAYLRPTESLVLMVQTMGRGLRLSPDTDKKDCLVLDYAGNIDRHSDWDDPILLEALKQTRDKDEPYDIDCPQCCTGNTQHARRCIGVFNNARCNYYFEFKECHECNAKNDQAARYCRACQSELVDPNAKLKLLGENVIKVKVEKMQINISPPVSNGYITTIDYICHTQGGARRRGTEQFYVTSPKAKNYFYGKFIRTHFDKAFMHYPKLDDADYIRKIASKAKCPIYLYLEEDKEKNYFSGKWKVIDKDF